MKLNDLKDQIYSLTSHILFDFNGNPCGVDPINHKHYDMWYGDEAVTVNSIDDVMSIKFFDGKSLTQIFDDIENLDY